MTLPVFEHPLVRSADRFAAEAHSRAGQKRKYTGVPYVEHARAVARIVATVTNDPVTVAVALAHDVVEHTDTTLADVEAALGLEVAQRVDELTDVSSRADGNRAARKALDRKRLARGSATGQTVKLADVLDNLADIPAHDPAFARTYLEEMEQLLGVLTRGDATLRALAMVQVLDELASLRAQDSEARP